ncbi:MAG: PDZ domain-containing protein [Clostridia bacterium]|nr:PDZ domain-containing protein [Clostridia bacterium]
MENMENKENLENNLEVGTEDTSEKKEPSKINTVKEPRKVTLWAAVVALLLAVLITFMTTFALLDAKYKAEQNAFVEAITGDDYFTLEYVKALFDEYYLGDLSGLTDNEIMDALIKMYISQTGDDYAYYWNEEEYNDYIKEMNGEGVGIGVLVNYLEDKSAINVLFVYPDSPAEEAGLEPGDLIVSVDGENVADIGYDNAVNKVRGAVGTQVALGVVKNDGASETLTATRKQFTTVSVISKMLSDNKTGYIRLLQFDGTTTDQFAKAYLELKKQGAEHFIFDVRDNPGGALDSVMGVLSFLVGDDVPLIEISDKQGNSYTENSSRELYCNGKYINNEKHSGKTVVLTNGNTASAGELFTSCMHEYSVDVITVGMKTYGKGTMQRSFQLPNGGAVKLTYRRYTAPGVENYDGKGLLPDVEQALSEEAAKKNLLSLTENEDDQLQKALKVLYGEKLD